MHRIFRVKAYEMEHGPHFNEEHARKAVMKMENEDGTRGQHWSLEETSALASQYGISLSGKFNRYDWYVALNMVYSDYYKVLLNITGSNNVKHYVEFAKAWLNDKDIDEGNKFCQLEMREMQNKIDALRQENNQLALSASQQAQTANIVSQLKSPCPVPAYFVPNPNCCQLDYYRYLLNRDNTTTAPAA